MSVEHRLRSPPVEVTIRLCEVHLITPKNKSKVKSWDEKITEITSAICALFNSSSGGFLRLTFDDKCSAIIATQPKTIDDVVRRIEQSALNFAGIAIVSEAFKLEECPKNDHELLFEVKPASKFCTIEYHLYLPTDYQVSSISFGDSSTKVAALLDPHGETQRNMGHFKEYCKDFRYKEKMPGGLREGQTVQFKLLKDDSTSNVSLADRMTNKSNKVVNYVSAFANHEGGFLFFGVDDSTYMVEGQVAREKEREKIKRKVFNVLSKMVWPEKTHERFWRLEFVSVFEMNDASLSYEVRPDTFVIVLSVAKCPGGVFVETPESYHVVSGRVERIPLPLWKQKIKEDASVGDGDSSSPENMDAGEGRGAILPVSVYRSVGAKGWNSPQQEEEYMIVAQLMENLRNNGNWIEIDRIASRVLIPKNTNADLKLAVTFQCTAAAYRQNKHKDAYGFLQSYHGLLRLAKNPVIFEVQELYSWSAIKRSERDYNQSYRFTYDALQKMQLITPGWITAWFLCNAASLLTMFASKELDPHRKEVLTLEAECYYRQALQHGQTITAYKKAAANLRHRVHINLAMLYLATSVNINSINYQQTISPECLKSAQESLRAAEDFKGPPMSGLNEFYFLLAKSDLCLRNFQHDPEANPEYMKKAIQYANDACKVATDNDFAEVLHYALSRITLLESIPLQVQNTTDLVDGLLKNINL